MSTGYKIMVLLHVVTIVAAFGPSFAWPLVLRTGGVTAAEVVRSASQRIQVPALVASIVFGFGALGMSDGEFKASQAWVSIAGLLLVLAGAVIVWVLGPACQRVVASPDEATRKKAAALTGAMTGVLHLTLVCGVILMIWKPGL